MAIWHLKAASDFRRMPWKNGRGETIEIARYPEGADLDSFDWRISMASVVEDGPFSRFPGIDRSLAVLSGTGLALHVEGQEERVLSIGSEPLAFPADIPTSSRLVQDPITDLNLMTRRNRYTHRMAQVPLVAEQRGIGDGMVFLILKGKGRATGPGFSADLADTDALRLEDADDHLAIEGTGILYRLEIRAL